MGFNCITSDLPVSGSWLRSIPRKPSFRTNPLGSLFLDCDPIAKSVTARILSEAGSFAGRVAVAHSQTSRPNMFYEPGTSTVAATRCIASPARSRLLTLTFDISQLPGPPRNWAMAGGANGFRAAL